MSTILLGACWPLQMPPTAKAVLISLADQANDAGVCWPAVGTICKRTCLSERAVQNAIRWLCQSGGLLVNRTPGRSTNYQINPAGFGAGTVGLFEAPARGDNGLDRRTPAAGAPRTTCTTPRSTCTTTPAAGAGDPAPRAPRTIKKPSREPTQETLARFARWWGCYPKKVGKGAALKAFAKLDVGDALLDTMLAAVERQRRTERWQKERGQFVPDPATWLNASRWLDEVDDAALVSTAPVETTDEYVARIARERRDAAGTPEQRAAAEAARRAVAEKFGLRRPQKVPA
jgi:hypothetical protein